MKYNYFVVFEVQIKTEFQFNTMTLNTEVAYHKAVEGIDDIRKIEEILLQQLEAQEATPHPADNVTYKIMLTSYKRF